MAELTGGAESGRNGSSWREILRELEVTPSKALGQNFLHDRKIVRRIVDVSGADAGTAVLEIGPGLGILTEELVRSSKSVTAIELDQRLAERLQHYFDNRAHIVQGDVLTIDLGSIELSEPYIVVANLPYSVATAAIQKLLEADTPPQRMTIMVQREVAERMAARPPEMSILAVAVQFYATPRIEFRIGAGAFIPRPRVESAVISLVRHDSLPLPKIEHARFFKLVRAGFAQRRKRLDNSITSALKIPKQQVASAISEAGLDPSRRAETLDVDEWVRLYDAAKVLIDA
jgi:16S rRNA (adenine1518-N6/adenine1519-N6)-dimethyltransferase